MHFGIPFPATVDEFLRQGAGFLTQAFQTAGTLDLDNAVIELNDFEIITTGGASQIASFAVVYASPSDSLHQDLVVKWPLDFSDQLRQLSDHLMEGEVSFALLSIRNDLPVRVPKCYFCDYHPESKTGILITEKIKFGKDGLEPLYLKGQDEFLPKPVEHYCAMITAMTKLAGEQKVGTIGDEIDRRFPFDREAFDPADQIYCESTEFPKKAQELISFVGQTAPQLFPKSVVTDAFLGQLVDDIVLLREHEFGIKRYLHEDADYVALAHWNLAIDNAWFWTGADGELRAGMFDWGGVRQSNLARALFGMFMSTHPPFLAEHREQFIAHTVHEYHRAGGPKIDEDELLFQFQLITALIGLAFCINAPERILEIMPEVGEIERMDDPRIEKDFWLLQTLKMMEMWLSEWHSVDAGAAIRKFVSSV